jgi:hypothetical protein
LDHDPSDAVNVSPSTVDPLIVGRAVFTGTSVRGGEGGGLEVGPLGAGVVGVVVVLTVVAVVVVLPTLERMPLTYAEMRQPCRCRPVVHVEDGWRRVLSYELLPRQDPPVM